ncbi:MAG: hypothetical protein K9J13_10820 [Saprospiraceae bacterium]|nr:hypothetical protein [Saprospiraceae bacterium]
MKKLEIIFSLLLVILIISCNNSTEQENIDYLKLKASMQVLHCGNMTYDTVKLAVEQFAKIDESKISNGLIEYYYDYGRALHFFGIMSGSDTSILINSNKYLLLTAENSEELKGDAYEEMSWNYFMMKDCPNAKKYMKLGHKYQDEKYWNQYLIEIVESACK